MRVGIDCRLAGDQHAGIGRYIAQLVIRVTQIAPQIDWVLFFFDQAQAQAVLGQELASRVKVVIAPVKHYSLAEQLKMPAVFGRAKLDVLHVPHFNVPWFYWGKLVVTIHDLLWHQYQGTQVTTLPSWQYWIKYLAYRLTVCRAVSLATRILVPAQTIKKTVSHFFPWATAKVVVTKEGVTTQGQSSVRGGTKLLAISGLDKVIVRSRGTAHSAGAATNRTLLYIGSLYPHKNITVVLQALKQLPSYRLVIIGARSVFMEAVKKQSQELQVESQVEFAGFVPDAELSNYYARATALVQPSLSEGFGLTGVEAMAQGVPVIASFIPIFQEIYGKHALFFDPHSPESFIKAVNRLETLSLPNHLEKAHRWASQYSWDAMATQTLEVYKEVRGL